jgi:hypothetical protein
LVLELRDSNKNPEDLRSALARLNQHLGVDERQLAHFIGSKIRTNEERGYRKWCVDCDAWTGHMILPTKAWQLQRCMRCGVVKELRGIGAKTDQGKLMLIRPEMTPGQILREMIIPVLGPSFIVRCMEYQFHLDVESKKKEILAAYATRNAARKERQFNRDVEDL